MARHIEEMIALYETSLEITAELGDAHVLQTIVEKAANLLGTEMGEIFLTNPDFQSLESIATYNHPDDFPDADLSLGQGLAGRVAETGQPMMVADYSRWSGRHSPVAEWIGRILGVPLKRGEKIIGVLQVFDHPGKSGCFSEDDIRLLSMFAAQATIAIENSQLYRQMQLRVKELEQAQAEVKQRNRELLSLQFAGATVASNLDLQHVLNTITREMVNLLNTEACIVSEWNHEANTISMVAQHGLLEWANSREEAKTYSLRRFSHLSRTLNEHQPQQITVDQPDIQPALVDYLHQKGLKTVLILPMEFQNRVVGLVEVEETRQLRVFTADEISLAQLLANQAAAAIQNRRLLTEKEQRAQQLAALQELDRAVSTIMQPSDLYRTVAHHASRLLAYDSMAIVLCEDHTATLVHMEKSIKTKLNKLSTYPLENSAVGWVVGHGQPLLRHNISTDIRFKEDEYLTELGMRTSMIVPLIVKGKVIGTWNLASKQVSAYTLDDLQTAQAVADQLGIALDNIRLFQRAQQEIVERKQAEMELRASEERFRQVVTSISDHIYVSELTQDGTQKNTYHSPNIEILTGYSRATFTADWRFWPSTLIHPDDRPKAAKQDEKLRTGQASQVEYRLIRADGNIVWVRDSARVEVEEDGTKLIYGVVADITDRKQRERELEVIVAMAEALRTAPTRADILPIVLDEVLDLLQMKASAFCGHDPDANEIVIEKARGAWVDAAGQRISLPTDDQEYLFSGSWLYVNSDIATSAEIVAPELLDDLKAIASVSLFVHSKMIGVLLVGHDSGIAPDVGPLLKTIGNIAANALHRASLFEALQESNKELAQERALLSERVEERTAELRAANTELAKAARHKDEFLANMSHELRTPLNAILGMSEILRSSVYGDLNDEQLNAVRHIEEGGNHLLALINDILDLSKIEAGKLELIVGLVSVVGLCESSMQFVTQTAQKKQIEIVRDFDERVDTIQGDERRLKQILVNLLSNAAKFTAEGGRIGLEVKGNEAENVVHFIVWDTGIGISKEDMKLLFKPFVQIDSGLTRYQEGTGLGLSLVYRLTRMHRGSVSLESEVGKGCRFCVSLPWQTSADEAAPATNLQQIQAEGLPQEAHSVTILLAEDNEAEIELVQPFLKNRGYQICLVRDGLEAVKLASDMQPDMIVMNMHLPTMNGLEVIRQIRQNAGKLASIPIIVLTDREVLGDRQQCIEAGATVFRRKPVTLSKLKKLIESHLSVVNPKLEQ